jgi:alpha-N-arabinofuranosidase
MILTKGSEIVLTPTYHVFRMYNVHQDATAVPVAFASDSLSTTSGRLYPTLSVSASKKENLHVSLANPSVDESKTVELEFDSLKPSKVSGEVLIGKGKGIEAVKSYNDFEGKSVVAPAPFKDFKTSWKTLKVTLPPASVLVLEIK